MSLAQNQIEYPILHAQLYLQAGNRDKEYDPAADLTFDTEVFDPLSLHNVTVYGTRRIAFERGGVAGVSVMEPITFPSVGDELCGGGPRATRSAFQQVTGWINTSWTKLLLTHYLLNIPERSVSKKY